jgi:hypothetical protein
VLTTAATTAAIAVVAAAGLAGCASAQPAGGTEPPGTSGTDGPTQEPTELPTGQPGVACVDWVSFATPAEAASDAGAVVRGTVVEQDGTAWMYGVESRRWLVDVEEVLERPDPPADRLEPQPELEVSPGERIVVVSTPETCSGDAYPGGDPLDPASGRGGADGTVIVLLSAASEEDEVDGYHLITPYQGVLTPARGGGLPAKWPAP